MVLAYFASWSFEFIDDVDKKELTHLYLLQDAWYVKSTVYILLCCKMEIFLRRTVNQEKLIPLSEWSQYLTDVG